MTLTYNVAGVEPSDIKITFSENYLKVRTTQSPLGVVRHVHQNVYDVDKAVATCKHGLLTVTIPEKIPPVLEIPVTVE